MSDNQRLPKKRVNFFDGQKITENDLDTEQLYNRAIYTDVIKDFHGSGVVKLHPFETNTLLDTRVPAADNPSKLEMEDGGYDGLGIKLDSQPSDIVRGTRIAIELKDVNIFGKNRPKILIIGNTFNGLDSNGILNHEFIEFEENSTKVTNFYYQKIIAVFFNNFSGGRGRTELEASKDSLDLISEKSGYAIFSEAEPLSTYSKPIFEKQTLSPSYDMQNFITSSTSRTIEDEISLALDASSNINDLYYDIESREEIKFEKNTVATVAYGQKFLAKTNNLQRIDLLLSVERDDDQDAGSEYDWTGDLVLGVYKLSTVVGCKTDSVPDDLIEFDPDLNPIMEISLSQDDFEELGYKLSDTAQIVSFDFSSTLLADPNIDPSLEKDKFYAFILSRRGDNTTGTIVLQKGYDNIYRKEDLGIELSIEERFSKQTTRFVEFDVLKQKYVDDSTSSLWFKIYSDDIEVMSGTAYTDIGTSVTVPKTIEFIGGNEISYYEDNISLKTVASGEHNYAVLKSIDKFSTPSTHPLTGNFVFTRIEDAASVHVLTEDELSDGLEDSDLLILSRITDNNVRSASDIESTIDKPGLIKQNKITIIDPSTDLLTKNLIGMTLTPDTECECTARYRIVDVVCRNALYGDLNSDGKLDSEDLELLLELSGNTINSATTEKALLNSDIEILNFVKSDLNNDGTIDGDDIQLLEDAIDGYINFSVEQSVKVLDIYLENILSDDDYPIVFEDEAATGITSGSTSQIVFQATDYKYAFAVSVGDIIEIETGFDDSGIYTITAKTIDDDGVTVTVTVVDEDQNEVSFIGSTGFNVLVRSGTSVNTYADNINLLTVPFQAKNYSITFVGSKYSERFIDICDLRRYTETAFIEQITTDPCACSDDDCSTTDECSPIYKNQHYFPGDIYIPNGQILTEPGVPHPGDYEYVNILMPLPPGTISDCSVNLYETFVKVDSNCKTSAGFPAMMYSDGSYVGCGDSGGVTDLSLGRVKFSNAIASLYVDAFVDGYAVDGYADAELSTTNEEAVSEEFVDFSYRRFDSWVDDSFNDLTFGTITKVAGPNEPAVFDATTIATPGTRYIRIKTPPESQDFEGDFIVDFKATRITWPSVSLANGKVDAFTTLEITNIDGSSATLKFGWRAQAGLDDRLFYSGVIRDSGSVIVDSFEYFIDAPDDIGVDVLFRLRRIDDAIFAYYIIPDQIGDNTSEYGHYIRLGSNPTVQPGTGSVVMHFELAQENTPTSSLNFIVNLTEAIIRSEYTSDNNLEEIDIGRVDATDVINRATINFPLNLPSRTSIVSATLTLTSNSATTVSDTYNVIPLDIPDADNIGTIFNIPETQNMSYVATFVPGVLTVGSEIEIDVTNAIIGFLANTAHLPGFVKAFVIEPEAEADSIFQILNSATLVITYEDITTGVVFQVGVSINPTTGIATLNTKNILYDASIEENRTVINFGVHLKKSGFKNQDLNVSIADLSRVGIGTCKDEEFLDEDDECYFVVGSTATGTFVDGPFPCSFLLP